MHSRPCRYNHIDDALCSRTKHFIFNEGLSYVDTNERYNYPYKTIKHNIIQIHNNVMWDWHHFAGYSHIQFECGEYYAKYCQSHKTLIWIWLVLWEHSHNFWRKWSISAQTQRQCLLSWFTRWAHSMVSREASCRSKQYCRISPSLVQWSFAIPTPCIY